MQHETVITKVGQIQLGNKVMVSDPCYEVCVWCQGILSDVKPGVYNCYIDRGARWGIRNYRLIVAHSSLDINSVNCHELQDFEVGVDSGTAGIFDYQYYREHHNINDEEPDTDQETWYDAYVCDVSEDDVFICDNKGVWSSSGYGDGGYDCYVQRNEVGEIIAMEVIFISDDEEDEDDYEEDYDI